MSGFAWMELLKSAGRFLWFGFLGVVVTLLTTLVTNPDVLNAYLVVFGQQIQIGAVLVLLFGFIAKAIDRYIHSSENTDLNGIAPNFLQR